MGIYYWDARWLDPATTLLIAVLILLWTWRLTRETFHILLEPTTIHIFDNDGTLQQSHPRPPAGSYIRNNKPRGFLARHEVSDSRET